MTTNRAWLGLVGAALVFAACDSSKDSLLSTGGRGGNSNARRRRWRRAPAARRHGRRRARAAHVPARSRRACVPTPASTSVAGRSSPTTAASARRPRSTTSRTWRVEARAAAVRAARPGQPVARPAAAAARAAAAAPVEAAAAVAQRGGGGGPAGRGGSSGAGGTASGGTGGNIDGGTDAFNCATASCARPYHCVNACGGPVISYNCCMCEAPAFDDFMGGACGDGGAGAISYLGCRYHRRLQSHRRREARHQPQPVRQRRAHQRHDAVAGRPDVAAQLQAGLRDGGPGVRVSDAAPRSRQWAAP